VLIPPASRKRSKSLETPIWRNTAIIRDNVIEAVHKLKAAPGKNILTDGSQQLVHALLEHDLVDELHHARSLERSNQAVAAYRFPACNLPAERQCAF